ncbi:hypothetical protein HLH34_18210 [Gluconacetobacter azotocaptans]|uniref:Uncharacterized protein n=1 Tax=Gluconacetobacter azotocaptans TaxID=142834 RepID=A0A7W4JW50_9PROT|nr:hypothetical protein [Gluconacetobacter azotocaptans]MBB2191870.1 hypothetical protein [Gluconacetobacter azotocaptans]MBM9403685.1 hypothetical protein [Gluconacetobacter azotocaptans]GBQ30048.1 hypothetical protein AA13594_1581 [Gluconacetobacter azotocaptans DSM 13594]
MGIFDALREFANEDANKVQTAAKAALDVLVTLGESKAEFFELKIQNDLRTAGTKENATVPIESIVQTYSKVFASASSGGSAAKSVIDGVLNMISPGADDTKKADVSTFLSSVVDSFLGKSCASELNESRYIVYEENYAIIRLDYHLWRRSIKGSGLLKEEVEDITVMTFCKSCVDVNHIGLNTFLALYQHQIALADAADGKKDGGKIPMREIESLKQILNFFKS